MNLFMSQNLAIEPTNYLNVLQDQVNRANMQAGLVNRESVAVRTRFFCFVYPTEMSLA